ncbi:hypothetical protein M378DRAFT_530989 [Amanita muscaria Koide BX008]|uniref:Uncharacterized protein n=1 Tax=Amanita muscaria (strain Koide BX008) TaxID=946122 RepID=A0A0C2X9S3_AMAMK|nr:hypothetical protein M378DRAFT_530989 [Amanita muscaria Koide BX008]
MNYIHDEVRTGLYKSTSSSGPATTFADMETPTFAVVLLVIPLLYVPSIWTFLHNRKLRSIPAVGPSGTLTSYIGAIQFLFHSQEMVQEGYNKVREVRNIDSFSELGA